MSFHSVKEMLYVNVALGLGTVRTSTCCTADVRKLRITASLPDFSVEKVFLPWEDVLIEICAVNFHLNIFCLCEQSFFEELR